jgi:hypothetical protein
MSQLVSTPAIALPTTLPRAPTANAIAIEVTPTTRVPTSFAVNTRPRCGTSVKVVRPVRWLHSLVTASTAIIGRMIVIGTPIAPANDP